MSDSKHNINDNNNNHNNNNNKKKNNNNNNKQNKQNNNNNKNNSNTDNTNNSNNNNNKSNKNTNKSSPSASLSPSASASPSPSPSPSVNSPFKNWFTIAPDALRVVARFLTIKETCITLCVCQSWRVALEDNAVWYEMSARRKWARTPRRAFIERFSSLFLSFSHYLLLFVLLCVSERLPICFHDLHSSLSVYIYLVCVPLSFRTSLFSSRMISSDVLHRYEATTRYKHCKFECMQLVGHKSGIVY